MGTLANLIAATAIGGAVVALALVALLHVLEPEFDPSWRMLSEYALGPYGAIMVVAFIAMGTSVLAGAVALSATTGLASFGLGVVAIGPLGAAFFDTDPITIPPAEMSRESRIHAVFGILFILGFPVAASVAALAGTTGRGSPWSALLAWLSLVPWIALVWFAGRNRRGGRPDGSAGPEVRVGWPNRAMLASYLGWVIVAAATTLR